MERYLYPILFAAAILLMIGYLYKTHRKWLITVGIRVIAGSALILLLNWVLPLTGLSLSIGVNPISVTCCGLLGIPGLLLLYGTVYFFTKF